MPGGSFDVDGKTAELDELKKAASAPDLWDDQDRALEVTRKLSRYEGTIARIAALESRLEDAEVLFDLAAEEDDPSAAAEVITELADAEALLSGLERETLFYGDYDDRTASLMKELPVRAAFTVDRGVVRPGQDLEPAHGRARHRVLSQQRRADG